MKFLTARLPGFFRNSPSKSIPIALLTLATALAAPLPAISSDKQMPVLLAQADLTAYGIEELMEINVTSVSKKSQKIADAAAAIYVITQDDIRRSGVTNIADALKMAPGVQVARIDSNKWAVTARGFNGRFANKLLVLMDGRSLYTPYFLGVYWEIQDTVLEDIERIEVIRGPGAALWGSNAVNGVVNIITKSADKTKGLLVSTGGGDYEKEFTTVRYGMALGDKTSLRLYGKHQERNAFKDSSGNSANDEWRTSRTGFRMDSLLSGQDTVTLQGDYFDGRLNETYLLYNLAYPTYYRFVQSNSGMSGGNILTRWQHNNSGTEGFSLQMYYDRTNVGMMVSPQKLNVADLDFQHRFSLGSFQDIVWGAGYRFTESDLENTPTIHYANQRLSNSIFSTFINDEISLIPSTVSLVLGSRFEQSNVSGFDVQPTGRLLWTVTPQNSVWGAVSRAVRTKTKAEEKINYDYRALPPNSAFNPNPLPLRLEIVGNPNFKSEEMISYEIGYRTEPLKHLSFDIATYYNSFKKLRVITPGTPYTEPISAPPANLVQPFLLSNDMHGHATGVEVSADWSPFDWWRLQGAYSFQHLKMQLDGISTDTINKGNAESDVPQNQFSLRSGFDLWNQVTLDLWLRGVDHLASIDGNQIPGYITMDARLAWKPYKNLELALVGQNLFDSHHPEFIPEYVNTVPTETVRSFYGKLTWQY